MLAFLYRSIQGRIILLGAVAILALIGTGWFSRSTVDAVKINGEAYDRIQTQKDLSSDLSPPPLNTIRAMMLVTGVDPGGDPQAISDIIALVTKERDEFQKSTTTWKQRLADGPDRTLLMDRVISLGERFYDIVDRELIPALRGGAKEKQNVDKIVNERLAPLHKQQLQGVKESIEASDRKRKQEQDAATELVSWRGQLLLAVLLASVLFTILTVWALTRGVRSKTAETIATVQAIANGDYARRMAEGGDEFGCVGLHVNEMAEMLRQTAEINKSQAIVEFKPDGSIVTANSKFLQTMGYTADDLKGQHHRVFVDPAFAQTGEYRDFWARLGRGEVMAGEFNDKVRAGKTSGSRLLTTRSRTATESC